MEYNKEKINFNYSPEKNAYLKKIRGIGFEEIELAIEQGNVITVIDHPNQNKYPNQQIYIIGLNDYIYLVPFVETSPNEIFFKTIIPSRKAVKKYLKEMKDINEVKHAQDKKT